MNYSIIYHRYYVLGGHYPRMPIPPLHQPPSWGTVTRYLGVAISPHFGASSNNVLQHLSSAFQMVSFLFQIRLKFVHFRLSVAQFRFGLIQCRVTPRQLCLWFMFVSDSFVSV